MVSKASDRYNTSFARKNNQEQEDKILENLSNNEEVKESLLQALSNNRKSEAVVEPELTEAEVRAKTSRRRMESFYEDIEQGSKPQDEIKLYIAKEKTVSLQSIFSDEDRLPCSIANRLEEVADTLNLSPGDLVVQKLKEMLDI